MTKEIKFIILILYLGNFNSDAAKCIMNRENWCTFSKISTTALFTQFYPTAQTPSNVEKVKFDTSRLHTFTNKMCENFRNLEELELKSVSLRKIEPNSFEECNELRILDLSNNQLTDLEENLFANNHKLESINLRGNYLSKLDLSVLNGLSSLMVLDLSKNRLQSLSVYKSPKIETLRELLVQDNQLTELNENMIVKKYPNLERMLIQRNSLQCERVEEMSQLFEEYEISMQEDEKNGQGRNQNIVGDVSCLSDRQWNSLSCETRFAAIRDEWMWLKTQMDAIDDEIEE